MAITSLINNETMMISTFFHNGSLLLLVLFCSMVEMFIRRFKGKQIIMRLSDILISNGLGSPWEMRSVHQQIETTVASLMH